jgi:hypothetical protein
LKGTFDFSPGKYGETDPCWAAHYCGVRDEHETDSCKDDLKYKRIEGDSAYASGCGHLKRADAAPEICGFEPGDLFPVESRQAGHVVQELGYKYLCFDLQILVRRLNAFDLRLFEDRVTRNGTYKTASASNDLKDGRPLWCLFRRGCFLFIRRTKSPDLAAMSSGQRVLIWLQ